MSMPMPVSCADTAVASPGLGFLPDLEIDLAAALLDLPPWQAASAGVSACTAPAAQERRPAPAVAAAAPPGAGAPHPAMRPVVALAGSPPAAPPQQARQGAAMPELQRLATFSSLFGSTSNAYTHSAYNGAAAAAGPHAGYAYMGACHSAPAAKPAFGLGGCGYTSGYCGPSSALPHPNQLQPQTAFPGPGNLKPLARAYSSVDGPGGPGGLRHSEDQQQAPASAGTYAHALPPGTTEWHPRQFCPSLPCDVHRALAPHPVPLVPPTSLLLVHRRRVQLQHAYAQCQVQLERLAAEAELLQAQVRALTMDEQHQGLGAAAAGPLASPWAAPWGCAPTAGL